MEVASTVGQCIRCYLQLFHSYPFCIYDTETDFRGYPGFGIFCEENKSLFWTFRSDYFIEDISCETQSLRLVNKLEVVNTSCVAPSTFFFVFDFSSIQFTIKFADLILFYNCTKAIPLIYAHSPVTCASTATIYSVAVLNTGYMNWNFEKMLEEMACERYVSAPVDWERRQYNQTVESTDYIELLKNGFSLQWTGINCVECQLSGDRCGV